MKRVTLLVLVLLVSIASAQALKISARKTLNFEPGLEFENDVCVYPDEITRVKLTPTGDIKEYISVEKNMLNLSDGPKCIPYTVSLPESFDRPGLHKGGIEALEAPKKRGGGQIVARVSITHQIWVKVPYPGQYLTTSLDASNAEAGATVDLKTHVTNKGNQTVTAANGKITIYERGDSPDRIDTVPLRLTNITSQQDQSATGRWNSTGFEVGRYRANLTLNYANRTATAGDTFKLGSLEVRLVDTTSNVTNDGIVPYHVTAESFWSEAVENVKATVTVATEQGDVRFETVSATLQPWGSARLKGYLDTGQLQPGTYDVSITLNYADTQRTYNRTLTVERQESGSALAFSTTHVLVTISIILALIVIALAIRVFRNE